VAEGDTIELGRVLFIADGDRLTLGKPIIEGAKVVATSKGEGKGKKIVVFKYKPKVRYRKKAGHRQLHTRLAIDSISQPGDSPKPPARKPRRRKKEVAKDGA
jgi:large subunit ribosomal protein L21